MSPTPVSHLYLSRCLFSLYVPSCLCQFISPTFPTCLPHCFADAPSSVHLLHISFLVFFLMFFSCFYFLLIKWLRLFQKSHLSRIHFLEVSFQKGLLSSLSAPQSHFLVSSLSPLQQGGILLDPLQLGHSFHRPLWLGSNRLVPSLPVPSLMALRWHPAQRWRSEHQGGNIGDEDADLLHFVLL